MNELPEGEAGRRWQCRACGRVTEPRRLSLAEMDRLEAEMRQFWADHPHVLARQARPEGDARKSEGWPSRIIRRVFRGRTDS